MNRDSTPFDPVGVVSGSRTVVCAEDLQVNDARWSRSYFVILLLAIVLLPGGAFVAAWTTQISAYVMNEVSNGRITTDEQPTSTQLFVRLGFGGIAAIGGTSLLVIICMGMKRQRSIGTVVSAIVFAGAMAFFFTGAFASHIPFLRVTWRLSP